MNTMEFLLKHIHLLNKKETPALLDFDVNDWGSCQYASALNTYNVLQALNKKFSFWTVLHSLDIVFDFEELKPFKDIKFDFVGHSRIYYSDRDDFDKVMNEANEVQSIDGIFEFYRNHSSDLWTTAPRVFDFVFKEYMIKFPNESDELNEMTNFETGFYCWVLNTLCSISEECFKSYDT